MYYLCYALLYCIIFAFGAAIGSFLNVCIYRLPKEESLWRNNSHCMTCGTPIRKRDLIPIFSWCRLRGKCHSCGAKIPFRYTLVESLNAVLYVLIYAYFGIFDRPLYAGLVCLFCSALVVVFFMDLDTQLINLYVLGFIGLLGIAATVYDVCTGNSTLLSHFIGAAAASVPPVPAGDPVRRACHGAWRCGTDAGGRTVPGSKGRCSRAVPGTDPGLYLRADPQGKDRGLQIRLWAVSVCRHGAGAGGGRTHCKPVLAAVRSAVIRVYQ